MGCDRLQQLIICKFTVSIHAPTWGATICRRLKRMRQTSFNPRTHMGCDLPYVSRDNLRSYVSIHAPTWGATGTFCIRTSDIKFQSTHPHGVRQSNSGNHYSTDLFQSTHPHGVRLHRPADTTRYYVSIHAPTWGATFEQYCSICSDFVSIHAPTWGATCVSALIFVALAVSIHAPTWGATKPG